MILNFIVKLAQVARQNTNAQQEITARQVQLYRRIVLTANINLCQHKTPVCHVKPVTTVSRMLQMTSVEMEERVVLVRKGIIAKLEHQAILEAILRKNVAQAGIAMKKRTRKTLIATPVL